MASVESKEISDAPAVSVADEAAERRRARQIVNDALLRVGGGLEGLGLRHRILPGLWHAGLNVVLSCFEPEEALILLSDRARGIVGEGTNADAPPSVPESMDAYVAEVDRAARAIMEEMDGAIAKLREAKLEDYFPETVLDAVLQVLVSAWGPHHVRRAISEQSALLIRGVPATANVMEPSRPNSAPLPKRKRKAASSAKGQTGAVSTAPAEEKAIEPPKRKKATRSVTAYATTDVSPTGKAAWASVLISHDDDGRLEIREIGGTLHDPSGRLVAIKSLHECVLAACEQASRANVLIETPSEACVRAAIGGGSPGSRLPDEDAIWSDIDRAASLHRIEFRHARHSLDRDLSERCDRMLRRLLEET